MTTVTIHAAHCSYDVLIGTGLLESSGRIIGGVLQAGRCVVVSDENVPTHLIETVIHSLETSGFFPTLITVEPGEKSKTLKQVGIVCDKMTRAGLDRTSFVVALGGGVIGDLAGFVAAIYHRGIALVQMPTTLLAQVDSSIGGKTGVNTDAGKNLLGAVHHPRVVITDVGTLGTLPRREMSQGFAEIIKHAIIRDPGLFSVLESFEGQNREELVRQNIEIKAAFVAADERDQIGERALLNFGHTIGHAIERAGDYRVFLHGEAVGLGIVAACDLSVRKAGLSLAEKEKVVTMLRKFDLPTRLPVEISREKILEALPRDKKFERGQLRFILTPALGSARVSTEVTMDDIRAAVANL